MLKGDRESIKYATEMVKKYPCNFDECGNCEYIRRTKEKLSYYDGYKKKKQWETFRQPGVGCCGSCHSHSGYFNSEKWHALPKELKQLFLPVVGFWRPFKGCVLKRKDRSVTCRAYHCYYHEERY